jgi:Protein of unknown function (DUF2550)
MTTVLLVLLGVLLVVVAVAFLIRRRFLLSGLGAVTMWLRPVGSPRWSVGVAWYGGDVLLWYRGVSLAVRPHERLSRAEIRVDARRSPGREDLALPSDVVVLAITTPEGPRELAMDTSTVTGFLSWMESAPPGT